MDEGHAAITLAVDRFREAFEAGDVEAIAAYYTDDLVKLRQGLPAEGKTELVRRLRETFREFDGRLEVTNDEIVTSGAFAFIRGRLVVTLTPRKGGEARVLRRRFLEIWRREGERWRVCRTMDNAGGD
jgi:ketosteroid isomerase-like protein